MWEYLKADYESRTANRIEIQGSVEKPEHPFRPSAFPHFAFRCSLQSSHLQAFIGASRRSRQGYPQDVGPDGARW